MNGIVFRVQEEKGMKNDISLQISTDIYAPASKVWEALITPKIIKEYFFGKETHSDWKVGSSITFNGHWKGRICEDKGTILVFKPGKLLRYEYWSPISGMEDKPENYVPVTYELSAGEKAAVLTIREENIPDEEMRRYSAQNWRTVLNNLKDLLEDKLCRP